jgi:hypothetical protein
MSTRARKLGKLRGQAYGASRMANMFARRAIIEADIEKREIAGATGAISSILGAGIDVAKTNEQFKTAKRGGFEGSLISFLTNQEEAGEAVLRGEKAKSIGKDTFFDVNTNSFKNVSTDINDRFGGTMESLFQTIESTEEQLGRILIGKERQDVIESAPFKDFAQEQDMALQNYRSMGIDVDNILGIKQERRGIFGRLRR